MLQTPRKIQDFSPNFLVSKLDSPENLQKLTIFSLENSVEKLVFYAVFLYTQQINLLLAVSMCNCTRLFDNLDD